MADVDCMTCLVALARGCPTNGTTLVVDGVTCASTTTHTNVAPRTILDFPAHMFSWVSLARRWACHPNERRFRWAIVEQ